MPANSAQPQILLLAESENASSLDRRALRDAGFANVRFMSSGMAAARCLADSIGQAGMPALAACSHKLEDMDGEQFCAIARQHPRLRAFPILLLMPNASEAEQLKVFGCGANVLLGRPYSLEELRSQILKLLAQAKKNPPSPPGGPEDTEAFESALASYGILLRPDRQPEDFFRVGMSCVEEKRWDIAIAAFRRALSDERLTTRAQLGMAAALKGKGDIRGSLSWLALAAETFARERRWQQARSAFARILQHDPEAKNPFLAEAHRLVKIKEYGDAAEALAQSVNLIPKGKTAEKFAAVCMGAEDPAAMFRAMRDGLIKEDAENEYLCAEIRQNLEFQEKEKRERQKMLAAERKWRLSQQMATQKNRNAADAGEKPEGRPTAARSSRPEPEQAAPLESPRLEADADFEDEFEDAPQAREEAPIIAPLTRKEASSGLFTQKPGLNEFLSVIKLTWKLAKRSGKKGKKGK